MLGHGATGCSGCYRSDQIRTGITSNDPKPEKLAENLLDHVNRIKLQREKIITIRVDNPLPVHMLCLQYGLSYMAAERVCAINDFWCPNFCQVRCGCMSDNIELRIGGYKYTKYKSYRVESDLYEAADAFSFDVYPAGDLDQQPG